jgi:hypothetical protein
MKQGKCVCPLSWSVHCNFTGDGKCNERGWACTPHPHQPGLFLPSWWNVRQKAAAATLCTLCSALSAGEYTPPVPKIIDPVFAKTSQNARFLLSENERFGLVFGKAGSINSGTGLLDTGKILGNFLICNALEALNSCCSAKKYTYGCSPYHRVLHRVLEWLAFDDFYHNM